MRKLTWAGGIMAGLAAVGLLAVGTRHRWLARLLDLPPARYAVAVRRNLAVPMADGVVLRADHYRPRGAGAFPTVLIRTPYGRGREAPLPMGLLSMFAAARIAERGYHVVVQTVRGRFDSGGTFEPRADDRDDGQATAAWIAAQPWFDGALGMWGNSYLGYMQWALAGDAPPYLKALAPSFTTAEYYPRIYPDGAFGLATNLAWTALVAGQLAGAPGQADQTAALARAYAQLPLTETDRVATGATVPFYQGWLAHPDPADPYWARRDYRADLARVTVPIHLVGGWHDLFIRSLLGDYAALRAAGQQPYLTIGPWVHSDLRGMLAALREGLTWFAAHLGGERGRLHARPVRLFIMGADEWRDLESWPPPTQATPLFLAGGGRLAERGPAAASPPDHYRYDPADPTPSLGGPLLTPPSGSLDNRALEARADVLCYTTPPLPAALEIVGAPQVTLFVRSTREHTDFFARLCAVHPDGRSLNLCDGLIRLGPGAGTPQPDGSLRVDLPLWPTAYRFAPGQRVRLQVSSGAHPRWSRNLGTGADLATGTALAPADQTLYHDAAHLSALVLPVSIAG